MSGHSKWSTIKRQKAVLDQKRGGVFTKIGRAISIAAKEGGGDPETNFKLRLAIEKGKQANMPKENIKRAIDRGLGKGEGGELHEIIYEGFGPEGVGILVEAVTDNTNRTASEIRSIFNKSGGNLAGKGAVSYLFSPSGLLFIKNEKNREKIALEIMDVDDIDDVETTSDGVEIYVNPTAIKKVEENIEAKGYEVETAEMTFKPKTVVSIKDNKQARKILELLKELENHDDVQKVYSNVDIAEEILENISANS